MDNHENIKKYRKLPVILNEDEQKVLLAQPNPKAPTGLRNICILRVMLDAGLTLSEVTSLRPDEIDFTNGCITVRHADGYREGRILWLGAENLSFIQRWIKVRPNAEYLFCTLKGSKLDDRYIREMVKRLAVKAKINKNVFPHSLRHTFAADLYRKTRNIRIVQEALGHVDLSTTMIYANVIDEKLEEAMKFFRKGETA